MAASYFRRYLQAVEHAFVKEARAAIFQLLTARGYVRKTPRVVTYYKESVLSGSWDDFYVLKDEGLVQTEPETAGDPAQMGRPQEETTSPLVLAASQQWSRRNERLKRDLRRAVQAIVTLAA